MNGKTIRAVEMTRGIRNKDAALYWKDKEAYLKKVKDAAKKLQSMRALKNAHGT
jgi:hypothetical protein